jgi:Leucine-rich repeat (LRR) protein
MKKNLPTIRQSTEVALSRANTLMDVADKILAKQSTDLVDESWMERLWQWADDNDIDDKGTTDRSISSFPRDRERLVNLTRLNLEDSELTELPKEIGNLVNLKYIHLDNNALTELPEEITNLSNLRTLSLYGNPLVNWMEDKSPELNKWYSDNICDKNDYAKGKYHRRGGYLVY